MKKLSFSVALLLISLPRVYAQSGTIVPTQADFLNNSTSSNVYALKGIITSTTPGSNSAGVRGQNNGTDVLGIGVWGSHAGNGWGVYGTTVGGTGVFAQSSSGVGVQGFSTEGRAAKFEVVSGTNPVVDISHSGTGRGINILLNDFTSGARGISVMHNGIGDGIYANSLGGNGVWGITSSSSQAGVTGDNHYGVGVLGRNKSGPDIGAVMGRNDSTGYGVMGYSTSSGIGVLGRAGMEGGTGVAGRFENISNSNSANALEAETIGVGAAAYFRNNHFSGYGSGAVIQKVNAYADVFTNGPEADLEVRHPTEITPGMSGLRIFNTGGSNKNWTLYTTNLTGNLSLYANGVFKGHFDSSTGAYVMTSDKRLKSNIRNYKGTLAKLMKIDVKSYLLNGSEKTEIGFLAQDVLNYFPEIVYNRTNDKGEQYYTMDYSRIGVLAVKALQEQQAIIQKQQSEINTLKAEMAALKKFVEGSLKK